MAGKHNLSAHLSVLFNKFGEVVEKAVLRPQKVKLVVPLLFLHKLSEKLAAIAGNKLGSELDNIQIKCRDGWRVCNELKLWRRFFGNNCLLYHLRLHLLKTEDTGLLCKTLPNNAIIERRGLKISHTF